MARLARGDEFAAVASRLFIELTEVRVLKSALRSRSSRSLTASIAPTFSLLAEIYRKQRALISKMEEKNTATRAVATTISGSVNPALARFSLPSNIGNYENYHNGYCFGYKIFILFATFSTEKASPQRYVKMRI